MTADSTDEELRTAFSELNLPAEPELPFDWGLWKTETLRRVPSHRPVPPWNVGWAAAALALVVVLVVALPLARRLETLGRSSPRLVWAGGSLTDLTMLSPSVGWAIPQYQGLVLTTHAGLGHFKPVSQFPVAGSGTFVTSILNARDAFIAFAPSSPETDVVIVAGTNDGGRRWFQVRLRTPVQNRRRSGMSVVAPTMVWRSPTHGYVLVFENGRTMRRDAWLYETRDGGRHWHRINTPRDIRGIGLSAGHQLLALLPGVQLEVSADNGRHWRNVPLPAVGGIRAASILWGPWFFRGQATGILVARVGTGGVVMTTKDGGAVWTAGHIFHNLPSSVVLFALNDQRWWVYAQSVSSTEAERAQFWETPDGGIQWRQLSVRPFETLLQRGTATAATLDFVSPELGYMNWMAGSHAILFRTNDGGLSWQRLPSFSHRPASQKRP